MNTVNIIEISQGNILQLVAFADTSTGNAKAEKFFEELICEHAALGSDEQVENLAGLLDDGTYDDGAGYEINIVHSTGSGDGPFENDSIQFPRLIAELETTGAFTVAVINKLMEEMDLTESEVTTLVDRAQCQWDEIKSKTH